MSNPGFIVDGHMEKIILEKICPGHTVRRLECNGRDVSYDAAGKRAASLIRLMKKNYPIIMIFDRECRKDSSEKVSEQLFKAIKNHGIHDVEVIIGVPDQMIENWLLADVNCLKIQYGIELSTISKCFEGLHGKNEIKTLIKCENYRETEDGPDLFEKVNLNIAYSNSSSLKKFIDKLIKIKCKCLSEINYT